MSHNVISAFSFDNLIDYPGFQFDYVFDWTILKYQQSQMATPPSRALVSDIYALFGKVERMQVWVETFEVLWEGEGGNMYDVMYFPSQILSHWSPKRSFGSFTLAKDD